MTMTSINFDRSYRSFTWPEALNSLKRAGTVEEVVGYLYIVGNLNWSEAPSPLEAVTLLLQAARSPHPKVAETAGRVLINRLGKVRGPEAKDAALAWLRDPSALPKALLRSPHPRFVQGWLADTCAYFHAECSAIRIGIRKEFSQNLIRDFTESRLLECLLAWGMPDLALGVAYHSPEIRRELLTRAKMFYDQKATGLQHEIVGLRSFCEELTDLSAPGAAAQLAERALHVATICQAWS